MLTTAGLLNHNNVLRPATSHNMHLRRVVMPRVTSYDHLKPANKDIQNLHMIIRDAEAFS